MKRGYYVPFYGVTLPPLKPVTLPPPLTQAELDQIERERDEAYQFHHRMVMELVQAHRDADTDTREACDGYAGTSQFTDEE